MHICVCCVCVCVHICMCRERESTGQQLWEHRKRTKKRETEKQRDRVSERERESTRTRNAARLKCVFFGMAPQLGAGRCAPPARIDFGNILFTNSQLYIKIGKGGRSTVASLSSPRLRGVLSNRGELRGRVSQSSKFGGRGEGGGECMHTRPSNQHLIWENIFRAVVLCFYIIYFHFSFCPVIY